MMSKETTTTTERAPIVVIMGHIDHGKSTLLDYIRKTNIVATEAGGITQHISAYEVSHKTSSGAEKRITFLDTPGHEAFKGMRARGARVADIAVLVVSAEDGVKEQTIEAYRSIKEADIPFIVAINKIDKTNANIEQTKLSLAEAEIYVEGYGGSISWVGISAKVGTGVPELLDTLLLLAEMEELKGTAEKPAEGVIIESRLDPKKGIIATLVITDGTIEKGMFAVAEEALTPIRSIENFAGKTIDRASFSSPIRLTGWSAVPTVGAKVYSFPTKKLAEEAIANAKKHPAAVAAPLLRQEGVVTIPLVIKTDVAGTLEAIEHELGKLKHERVLIRIIQKGVGTIGESDVKSATGSSGAVVIGFHTKVDALAADLAFRNNVTIMHFDIIYKLTEYIEEVMKERAPHIEVAEETGTLKVIRFFSQQKEKQVIGGRVETGKIVNGAKFKIMRRDAEIGEGRIIDLQQQKIKSQEVGEGAECGVMVESKFTITERDILVPYVVVKKQ